MKNRISQINELIDLRTHIENQIDNFTNKNFGDPEYCSLLDKLEEVQDEIDEFLNK